LDGTPKKGKDFWRGKGSKKTIQEEEEGGERKGTGCEAKFYSSRQKRRRAEGEGNKKDFSG